MPYGREIACGSEIRLRRVKERIPFHIATQGSQAAPFSIDRNQRVRNRLKLQATFPYPIFVESL